MKGNIELKQYDGTKILPKDDAILYDMIVGQSGIIQGCELTWLGSNQVHINHGYGIIKGRLFEIADQTFYAKLPTTSDSYFGYIVIVVDLENTVTPITFTPRISETAITTWTQDSDMNFTNGKYEMPIAEYKATNSGITSFSDVTKKITGVLIDAFGRLKVPSALNVGGCDAVFADGEGINFKIMGPKTAKSWEIDSAEDTGLRFIRWGNGSVKVAYLSENGDFVNADGVSLNSLKSNFQAGVDSVYNACASVGATPASKNLTDICNAVKNGYNNGYNGGYNAGYNNGKNDSGHRIEVYKRQSQIGHTPPTNYVDLRVMVYNNSGALIADSGWLGDFPNNEASTLFVNYSF